MKALVIDDEQAQRDLMCEALEGAGWHVDLAEDGIAGLGRVPQLRPDIIVVDLRMPHLDGRGLLTLLRSTRAGQAIPVVLVTGSEVSDDVRALADAILVKPFGATDLLRAVAALARRPGRRATTRVGS